MQKQHLGEKCQDHLKCMDYLQRFRECGLKTIHRIGCNQAPVLVELKLGVTPVWVRQYSLFIEAMSGIQKHTDWVFKHGRSPWNTPLLLVWKPNDQYRPVQDLRTVNRATVSIHPVIPDPLDG